MKLLLTSAGITNESIATALTGLAGHPAKALKVALIPTAANGEPGNKDWFIAQFTNLQQHGFSWIDIVDISAVGVDWEARLSAVDIIFVSGGNTFHLLHQMRHLGFGRWLIDHFANKVYVGVSAGTIVATARIDVATIPPADQNTTGVTDLTGLGFVDFEVEPHCEGERFTVIENYAKLGHRKVYAIDDQTAIQVVDGKVQVVSEGKWQLYE